MAGSAQVTQQGCGSGTSPVPPCRARRAAGVTGAVPRLPGATTVSRGLGAEDRQGGGHGPGDPARPGGSVGTIHSRTQRTPPGPGRGSCSDTSPSAKGDTWWCDKHGALFTPTQPAWELRHPQRLPPPPPPSPSCPGRQLHPAGTPEPARGHRSPDGLRSGLAPEGSSLLGKPLSFGGTTHPEGSSPPPAGLFQEGRRKRAVALCQVVTPWLSMPPCSLPHPSGMCRFLRSSGGVTETNEAGKSLRDQ